MDDLDSSDQEFEVHSRWTDKLGKKSRESLIQTAIPDRMSTKRTLKGLTFHHGTNVMQTNQQRWLQRFETFRVHTLKQSTDVPFNGNDLVRFFDAMLRQKLTRDPGKPGPNDDLIISANQDLIRYGTFRWSMQEGFTYTKQDSIIFNSFMSECVNKGRVTAGHWRLRTWIGYVTLSRMVRAYVDRSLAEGVLTWDVPICRWMSVVLIAALGCRAGDIALSKGYVDEAMRYEHVEFFLVSNDGSTSFTNQEPATLANVRATFTIAYAKGLKKHRDDNLVKHLGPLLDPSSRHMCPISLLLVHALRHGMVEGGTSLRQVLDHAAQRPDKRIRWIYPRRPVVPALDTHTRRDEDHPQVCILDKPAPTDQILDSIQAMGTAAGVLDRVYTHATRGGLARDMRLMPASSNITPVAFQQRDVAGALGHTEGTRSQGVTLRYSGDTDIDLYQARAAAKVVHSREPKIALVPSVVAGRLRQKVTDAERAAISGSSDVKKSALDARVRKARMEELRETTPVEARRHRAPTLDSPSPLPTSAPPTRHLGTSVHRPALAERSVNTPSKRSSEVPDLDREAEEAPEHQAAIALSRIAFPAEADENDHEQAAQLSVISNLVHPSFADPSLLDPALRDAELEAEATSLFLGVSSTQPGYSEPDSTDSIHASPSSESTLPESTDEFVDSYSRYNVVFSVNFARAWPKYNQDEPDSFERTIGPHADRGNSRDDPTPFILACRSTPGCEYTCLQEKFRVKHEPTCTLATVAAKQSKTAGQDDLNEADIARCEHPKCGWKVQTKDKYQRSSKLAQHIKSVHDWTAKPCDHGCKPKHFYKTQNAYQRHEREYHNEKWPLGCPIPGCQDETEYRVLVTYNAHLFKEHNLQGDDLLPYQPKKGIAAPRQKFAPQRCIELGCANETVFAKPVALRNHLKADHGMDDPAAKKAIRERAVKIDSASSDPELQSTATSKRKATEAEAEDSGMDEPGMDEPGSGQSDMEQPEPSKRRNAKKSKTKK